MEILSAKALCKSYGSGENQVKALDHVSLSVENGEFVAVIGTLDLFFRITIWCRC